MELESEDACRKRERNKSTSETLKSLGNGRGGGGGGESTLYEVVCPAVYVLRVFGLAPYELAAKDYNRPRRLRPSYLYCIYSVFWMTVYTYIVVMSMIRFRSLDRRDKPVLGATEDGKLILNYLVAMVDLLLCMLRRRQFVHVWNAIQDFDESFQLGNAPEPPAPTYKDGSFREGIAGGGRYGPMLRRTRFWVWLVLVVSVVGWTSINQLGMHAFNETYLQNVGYMLIYVGTFIAVLKFCGLMFLLGQRFAHLNELVRKQERRKLGNAGQGILQADAIVKKIETSYDQLLSTSEKLHDIYSWSLFLFLLNLFCHTVSNMYFFVIWTIVEPSYLKNPKVVFCLFSWLLIYLIQMVLIHVACHFTSFEANRMACSLLNWRRRVHRHSKQYEFSSTLHFLNRRLNFTAGGCFNVDLPLLTSTFGYLSTYLVILLQMQDSSNS